MTQSTDMKWTYSFSKNKIEGDASLKDILGNKGANLAQMCKIGINVPPGFTVTTELCDYYYKNNNLPNDLFFLVNNEIKNIENILHKKWGGEENPLLISVRSGSVISMPGMMDTILNIGLNDQTVCALSNATNDERFAYDSYRRFIQIYGEVVLGLDHYVFEELIFNKKQELNISSDLDLSAQDMKDLVIEFKKYVLKETKEDFPSDVNIQLWNAIKAVLNSWMNPRAIKYRSINNISESIGTAVTIQSMVFGNMGNKSLTGVAFSRNPSNGNKEFYGEFLINAQGEDIVSGIRTPHYLTKKDQERESSKLISMEEYMPDIYTELINISKLLEAFYKDMQDIEFTVEMGKLWILQTRSGKRTTHAAIKISVDLVKEGMISKNDALMSINPNSLNQILHHTLNTKASYNIIGKGLPASPGAATGIIVFSADEAEKIGKNCKVILVRTETSPEDIHGMSTAEGILTARGGMTSHAAVVARGMGKCCVCGASEIIIDYEARTMTSRGFIVKEGDKITLNGNTGDIILGEVEMVEPNFFEEYFQLMEWAKNTKKLEIRANAETVLDSSTARKLGAEGIGLCRTEHMFFDTGRINYVREMIISDNEISRQKALDSILPLQINDFIQIFKIMDSMPVNIRLLDPPLHEFLPTEKDDIIKFAKFSNIPIEHIKTRIYQLTEHNPMLGHRGCRVGITYPEIYKMQVEAIFRAMCLINKEVKIDVEIMVPLIGSGKELILIKKLIDEVASNISQEEDIVLNYKVGTMIELPRAALKAQEIAEHADYFSFGTNDLTQTTYGISRDDSSNFINNYLELGIFQSDPFTTLDINGVGELVKIAVERGRLQKSDLKIGVCGEHGGDPNSIKFFHKLELNYVSCSPYRVPIAILSAAQAAIL